MASAETGGDKYRSFMDGEGEKNTVWRHGVPPNFDVVNKLFEEERTKEWAEGSVEEKVQRLLKTWEMEMFHKLRPEDQKSVHSQGFTSSTNGETSLRQSVHRSFWPHKAPTLFTRDEASDPKGVDRHRWLQRVPGNQAAAGAPHLRPGHRDVRLRHGDVPHGVPPGLRHRGARRLLHRPAQGGLQVPALGVHGGAVQGPPSSRPARGVVWHLHFPC
uniref:Pathogen-related protein n=1 Tax=Aegilops tauschii subsp. strangulata TaxID=200361 RepID=A0A453MP53_AEGTS